MPHGCTGGLCYVCYVKQASRREYRTVGSAATAQSHLATLQARDMHEPYFVFSFVFAANKKQSSTKQTNQTRRTTRRLDMVLYRSSRTHRWKPNMFVAVKQRRGRRHCSRGAGQVSEKCLPRCIGRWIYDSGEHDKTSWRQLRVVIEAPRWPVCSISPQNLQHAS